MTKYVSTVAQVGAYFASKGKVLTADEYKNADDAPIRFQVVKRNIGSWSRLISMVGDISQYNAIETITTPTTPEVEYEGTPLATEAPEVVKSTKGA